ncbi:MAG: aspartate aminotransferase family protein [Planctomycetota bacterium]|jgi:acetylornithine/succinyldiaminopimelate/putrescine aminotransferase
MVHPERMNATLARVGEILEILLGAGSEALFARCVKAAGPGVGLFDPLTASAGEEVALTLVEGLGMEKTEEAADLLMDSELSTTEVIQLHQDHKIPVSRLEDDLLPVAGLGATIRDARGKTFIDLDANYSATNLGNANEEIALGLFNQARRLVSQKEDRIQVARARFLKAFQGFLPERLTCFYWQNSGGEAVDKALKIAKACTGQTGVIAFEGGFHGRTHGAVAVTHEPAYRKPFGLDHEDWVRFCPWRDLPAAEAVLEKGEAKIVILELVQGEEAGVRPASPEFAAGLRGLCDRHDALLIVDEVQTGFGRVASGPGEWFACQRYGIAPDVMVIGKSFGGGYPVTAVVTTAEISNAMKPGYDGSTFGGNPMAMTAALIATRQMKALDLPARVAERSAQFAEGLAGIGSPSIRDFRCAGLMIGVDLPGPSWVPAVQEAMAKRGAFGSLATGATLRWMPPLVITRSEVEAVLTAFAGGLAEVEEAFGPG